MATIPDVISRYYEAAVAGDLEAVVDCFTPDAHVRDEGHDYHGAGEIRGWREGVASLFTYTTTITAVTPSGDNAQEFTVSTHLEGDFPGGVVDLEQRFLLEDGLISDLTI